MKADAPSHKILCQSSTELKGRPTAANDELAIKALVFPIDATAPQWVWIQYGDGYNRQVKDYIPDGGPGYSTIGRNRVLDRDLKHVIHVHWGDNYFLKRLKMNQSVKLLTQGMVAQDWRGPMIAYASGGYTEEDPGMT